MPQLFRFLNVEIQIWPILLAVSCGLAFAGAGSAEEEAPLLPPHPEIPPNYWEENRIWIVVAGVLVLVSLTSLIWVLVRKRAVRLVPPDVEARQALDSLALQPEDGRVVSQVSRVLKRYFITAFNLPAGELTTTEFRHSLEGNERIESEFAGEVGEFLQRCDQYKFAPASERVPGAAQHAMKFVNDAEAHRARLSQRPNTGQLQAVSREA